MRAGFSRSTRADRLPRKRFTFRGLADIGEYHATNNPNQFPWSVRDYADPKTALGITHLTNAIPTGAVADEISAKNLMAVWWCGTWLPLTANGAHAADSATITVNQSVSTTATSGHLYIGGSKVAWSSRAGSVFTVGAHPALANGEGLGMFTRSDAQLTGYLGAVAGKACNSHIWYLVDEPAYSPSFVAAINDRVALVKGIDAAAVCVFSDYTYDDPAGRRFFDNWAAETIIDEVWWSGPYPVTGTLGNRGGIGSFTNVHILFALAEMASAAAAGRPTYGGITPGPLRFKAHIGVHNFPYSSSGDDANPETEYGPYTGINARMPSGPWAAGETDETGSAIDLASVCQVRQQVDAWRSPLIGGLIVYTYTRDTSLAGSPPANWSGEIRNRLPLRQAMKEAILS